LNYLPNYEKCYVCGDSNPEGLQYRFWVENDFVVTHIKNKPEYEGHGMIHGGVSLALLDEAMGLSATYKTNRLCVTAEITIQYLQPLAINKTYIVRAQLVSNRNILCKTYGEIIDGDRRVLIKSTGKYVPLSRALSHKNNPQVFNDDEQQKESANS
jgi:uncharacterized protein (TIGR00369 family)